MTAKEFKDICKANRWTYQQAAAIAGKSHQSVKLYASGRQEIPEEVARRVRGFVLGESHIPVGKTTDDAEEVSTDERDHLHLKIQNLEEENLRLRAKIDEQATSQPGNSNPYGPPVGSEGHKPGRKWQTDEPRAQKELQGEVAGLNKKLMNLDQAYRAVMLETTTN